MRMRQAAMIGLLAATGGIGGCVERTIGITSEPSGALVWLNDREVGRTPVEVGFVHYGTYDVRLVHDGYEPLLTTGEAKPPLWDVAGLDLVAELVPARFEARVDWHYELTPRAADPDVERARLVDRARSLRSEVDPDAPPPSE